MTNKIFLLPLILLALFSCRKNTEQSKVFNKVLYTPEYSSNFMIKGNDKSNDVLITVFNPWQDAEDVAVDLIIERTRSLNLKNNSNVLKDKAERIVCMSSTHIAMLDALDAVDKIVGVSGKEYVSNKTIQESNVPDIGYEGYMDYEALLAASPDLVLLFSVNGVSEIQPRLEEFGIPYLYIGDYVEEDPLGKAEWIVVLGELLGKRDQGIEYFNKIAGRYNVLKDKIKVRDLSRPKVMVNAPFLDSWFMPSGKSYIAKMISDAGGEYIYKKNTGTRSVPISMEEALKLISEADYWINVGTVTTLQDLQTSFPQFIDSKCIKENNIYNNNALRSPGGGNDCYESGVINPDIVLRDLIKLLHPGEIEEDFVYYQKIE